MVLLEKRKAARRIERRTLAAACASDDSTQHAGLRRMQVHDVGIDRRHEPVQCDESSEIGERVNGACEGHFMQPDRRRDVARDIGRRFRASRIREVDFVTECRKPRGQARKRGEHAATERFRDLQNAQPPRVHYGSFANAGAHDGPLPRGRGEWSSTKNSMGSRLTSCLANEPKSGSNMPCTSV